MSGNYLFADFVIPGLNPGLKTGFDSGSWPRFVSSILSEVFLLPYSQDGI